MNKTREFYYDLIKLYALSGVVPGCNLQVQSVCDDKCERCAFNHENRELFAKELEVIDELFKAGSDRD